ncbi:unnamed protein product [Cyprideis torosa]|uniref:Uncharacterized protein n=1 Tax=Cyprideis torosa TaxID=163714 RepID=A0A7R8WI34_9CRUS|nr:unnamed protein product [Cyprideis torosa]CAG0900227.1 unnamed protein product [Cyprideis torosa]
MSVVTSRVVKRKEDLTSLRLIASDCLPDHIPFVCVLKGLIVQNIFNVADIPDGLVPLLQQIKTRGLSVLMAMCATIYHSRHATWGQIFGRYNLEWLAFADAVNRYVGGCQYMVYRPQAELSQSRFPRLAAVVITFGTLRWNSFAQLNGRFRRYPPPQGDLIWMRDNRQWLLPNAQDSAYAELLLQKSPKTIYVMEGNRRPVIPGSLFHPYATGPITNEAEYKITFRFKELSFTYDFFSLDFHYVPAHPLDLPKMILGRDFLRDAKATIVFFHVVPSSISPASPVICALRHSP